MRKAILLITILGFGLIPSASYAFVHSAPAATETVRTEPTRFQQWKARMSLKVFEKKAAKAISGEAIASFGVALLLVLAVILSVGGLFLWPLLALAASVLGILALRRIKKNPDMGGKLLALLGLFIGGLGVILSLLILIGFSGQH